MNLKDKRIYIKEIDNGYVVNQDIGEYPNQLSNILFFPSLEEVAEWIKTDAFTVVVD